MNLDLKGKNALVGGSSRGIGKAVAIELANLGAEVTLLARSEEQLQALVSQLNKDAGQQHSYICIDIEDGEDLQEKISKLAEEKAIHILINNTGGPPAGPVATAQLAEFGRAFYNHLLTNHRLAQTLLPGMRQSGYGRIINIISTSVKQPLPGLGVSNTIRAAVANWSKTLAGEVGQYGITVNNVLPGATNTERLTEIIENKAAKMGVSQAEVSKSMKSAVPLGRFAQAEEIANAVAFLASPAAAYISGINLPVDGGRLKSL